MSKLQYKNGQTSVVLRVKIMDSTSTTGGAKTGLTFSSSGLIISTIADNEATATAYTQAGSTIETVTTLGAFAAPTATKCRFKEVDSTNHPGLYEIQIADARWAVSNARSVIVTVSGVSGMAQVDAEVQLTAVDPQDAVRGGMTALPNVASGSAGAVITSGTGTSQLSVSGGVAQADAAKINGVATTSVTVVGANVGTTQPINFTGTAGSALAKVDVVDFGGAAGTFSGGRPEVNTTHAAGTAWGSGAITAASIASNAITSAKIASGAVISTTFAADSITASALAADAVTEIQSGLMLAASYTAPDNTSIAATKLKTDNLPSDPADASDIAASFSTVNSTLATIVGYIDTEVAAIYNRIGAPAGATLAADVAAVLAALPNHVKKNTALAGFTFPMVLSTDGRTLASGKTVTATRSIDGAAFASCANSAAEIGSTGVYKINLAAADTNGDTITLKFSATACDDRIITIVTQP